MTDKAFKCLVCRTNLPTDADRDIATISCPHCDSPNPNPKNLTDNKPASYSGFRNKTQTLRLDESTISLLISILCILLGALTITLFTVQRPPIHYLAIISLVVFIPVFGTYFVPAHWEKVCKWAASETGEKYQISYNRFGIDWVNYLESYILQVWFLGMVFTRIFHPKSDDSSIIVWLGAIVFGIGTLSAVDLLTKTVARAVGLLISRSR